VSTACVSDADLVARARRGDSAAFGELVDRHRTAVYRATRAVLGSHDEAEDAAQDAFVVAYERLASFRGDASFKTLENGKSMVAAQSADPIGDRQVTVEVKATILK
jgi:hypothetical protein